MSPAPDSAKYRVFRLGGQSIFAVAAHSKRERLAGIERYQPISFKRAWYRRVMKAAIWTGLDRLCSAETQHPIAESSGFDLGAWLESLVPILNVGKLSVAIFWPPQADRGRVYVHVLDAQQRPVGFAKVSFDDSNDACLDHESRTLVGLTKSRPENFRVPRVLNYRAATAEAHAVLLLEPIPGDARPIEATQSSFPVECVRSFAGEPVPMGVRGLDTLSWWAAYEDLAESLDQGFVRELAEARSEAAMLCRSHGDFVIANIVRDSEGEKWIFDWEESCRDGPILADEVSFFLNVHWSNAESGQQSLILRFRERFLDDNDPQRRVDVMLALAYRSTVHAQHAGFVISRWDQF